MLITANSVVLLLDVTQNVPLCLKVYIASYTCFLVICAIELEVTFFVLNRLVKRAKEALQVAEFNTEKFVGTAKDADAGV